MKFEVKFPERQFNDWLDSQAVEMGEDPAGTIDESARWGFEQARKQMLKNIKTEWKRLEETDKKNMKVEQDYFDAFEWFKSILEGELK